MAVASLIQSEVGDCILRFLMCMVLPACAVWVIVRDLCVRSPAGPPQQLPFNPSNSNWHEKPGTEDKVEMRTDSMEPRITIGFVIGGVFVSIVIGIIAVENLRLGQVLEFAGGVLLGIGLLASVVWVTVRSLRFGRVTGPFREVPSHPKKSVGQEKPGAEGNMEVRTDGMKAGTMIGDVVVGVFLCSCIGIMAAGNLRKGEVVQFAILVLMSFALLAIVVRATARSLRVRSPSGSFQEYPADPKTRGQNKAGRTGELQSPR